MKQFLEFSWFWRYGVNDITTTQTHSTNPELSFCAGLNPVG